MGCGTGKRHEPHILRTRSIPQGSRYKGHAQAGSHHPQRHAHAVCPLRNARTESRLPAQINEAVEQFRLGRPIHHHEGFCGQIGQSYFGRTGKRMADRQSQQHLLAGHHLGSEILRAGAGKPYGDRSAAERIRLFVRLHFAQGEGNTGVTFPEPAQEAGQHPVHGISCESDDEAPLLPVRGPQRLAAGDLHLIERTPGFLQKRRSCQCQFHGMTAPVEQLHAQFFLETLYLTTQRRLAQGNTLSGAAEVLFLGGGYERKDVLGVQNRVTKMELCNYCIKIGPIMQLFYRWNFFACLETRDSIAYNIYIQLSQGL